MKKEPVNKSDNIKPGQVAAAPVASNTPNAGQGVTALVLPDAMLQKIFLFSLLGMLLITWFSGYNVGFHQDEMDMSKYGQANYAFYLSGGKDTSFLGDRLPSGSAAQVPQASSGYIDPMLRYYGSAFEYIATGFNKIIGASKGVNEFNTRHFFNQFFGILTLLFAGLIARKFAGWRAAIFTIWLAFLSPSFMGHFYFNTKDIPFCAGYLATIYFTIKFMEELPAPGWKTSTWLMLSFYFTVNTRIGGLLLVLYFGLFAFLYLATNRKLLAESLTNAKAILLKATYAFGGALALLILTWPFILINPYTNLMAAIGVIKKFPIKININFEGAMVSSLEVPTHYLPKFMLITAPVLVVVLLFFGVIFYFAKRGKYNWKIAVLLLFSVLFPPVYAIASHVSLYSGWRHFLFIYPGLCIIASLGLSEVIDLFKKPAYQLVIGLLCIAALIKPVAWSIQNHPYEYCYFNEIAGGFKNAYYNYDTDYWEITAKKAVDWLIKNEPVVANSKDTVVIASNLSQFVDYYLKKHCPGAKIKVISSGVTGRNELYWHYAIYNTLFVKPDYLENFFPPAQTVYAESIDGLPVTVVVKDTARLDYKALEALKVAKHQLADSLYAAYINTTKDHNPAIDAYISVAKGSLNDHDAAIEAANRALQYHFSNVLDYNAQCGLGIAYANKRQFRLSVNALKIAERLMPKEHYSKDILRQVYMVMEEEKAMQQQPK